MSELAMNRWRSDRGSLPLTLLATIVVAGLATVLIGRMIAGERTVRFDNTFTRELHAADAGVSEALFHISGDVGAISGTATGSTVDLTASVDDYDYAVEVLRQSERGWRITSTARPTGGAADAPERTVVAVIEERPLFFPGAFGDNLIALNGTSTRVDSYNSKQPGTTGVCTLSASQCAWGTHDDYGTGNGTIGTNGDFDFDGNTTLRPGGAFLYDWADNEGQGITASDPFGDRCDGNPCTTTYVSTVPEPLEYDTPEKMGFIDDKFAAGGGCADTASDRYAIPSSTILGETTTIKGPGNGNDTTSTLTSYATTKGWSDPGVSDPTDPNFQNYYCALSVQFYDDINLAASVDSDNPVVIFVKNSVSQGASNKRIACVAPTGSECQSDPDPSANPPRPVADWLQVYVAGLPTSSAGASNVTFRAGGRVAGVFYAPRSGCGSSGSGGLDIYGAILCRSMDNVGNWEFHFDDALGSRGSGEYVIGSWNEE